MSSRFRRLRCEVTAALTSWSSAAASPVAPWRTSWRWRGAQVVLIEAKRIGRGSTAASTALLMQEPDADFGDPMHFSPSGSAKLAAFLAPQVAALDAR